MQRSKALSASLLGPLALAAVATLTWAAFYCALTVDDAYIFFRYAHNAYRGHGLTWNIGEQPVEGVTSLLWTVALVPFAANKYAIYGWAKVLGLGGVMIAIALAVTSTHRVFGRRAALFCGAGVAVSSLLAFHAMSGLETGLAIMLVMLMAYSFLGIGQPHVQPRSRDRWTALFGVTWLLGGMTRPELVAYGLLISAFGVSLVPEQSRRRCVVILLTSFLLPGAVYFAVRSWYFGHLLPLPFYAKQAQDAMSTAGVGYVTLGLFQLVGGAAAMALLGRARLAPNDARRVVLNVLVWPSLLLCLVYVFFDPDMGFVHRFLVPYFLPLLVAAAAGLDRLLRSDSDRCIRMTASVLAAAMAVLLLGTSIPAYHVAHVISGAARASQGAFGELLAELPESGRLAAFNDVGAAAFFSDWFTVEGMGLVTPEISIDGWTREELVRSFRPDVVILSGCPMELAQTEHRASFEGYRFVRAVPWLVFSPHGHRLGQCVLVRTEYPHAALLETRTSTIGAAVIPSPWYFSLYSWLKTTFNQ